MRPSGENEFVFSINGKTVEVEFRTLPSEAMDSIRDAIRENDFFKAKSRAIGNAIESLSFDGKPIIRKLTRSERRSGTRRGDYEGIPNEWDRENDEFLYDRLLRIVVSRENWLTLAEPFVDVFEDYAEEDAPKQNPTPLRDAAAKTGS